jgi:hypothetical protein
MNARVAVKRAVTPVKSRIRWETSLGTCRRREQIPLEELYRFIS